MNCPNCHCPRGEPLTVATNSLVTRCHNAFHAVAVSLARPDDFATETAKDTTPPHPTHHGAAKTVVGVYCPVHGQDRCSHAGECVGLICVAQVHGEAKVVVCTGCGSSDGGHPLDCPTRVEFPYTTPVPGPTANGANGFRWCHSCQSVAEVAGHECAPAVLVINGSCSPEELAALKGEIGGVIVAAPSDMGWEISEGRRERAEFAESLLCAMAFDHGLERFRRHFGGVEGYCHEAEECVFCGAARGGGR